MYILVCALLLLACGFSFSLLLFLLCTAKYRAVRGKKKKRVKFAVHCILKLFALPSKDDRMCLFVTLLIYVKKCSTISLSSSFPFYISLHHTCHRYRSRFLLSSFFFFFLFFSWTLPLHVQYTLSETKKVTNWAHNAFWPEVSSSMTHDSNTYRRVESGR